MVLGDLEDLMEVVRSLIWAGKRCDIKELEEVQRLLTAKYGKPFAQQALRARPGTAHRVNERIMIKLSEQPPNRGLCHTYMKQIAGDNGVSWDPSWDPPPAESAAAAFGAPAAPTGATVPVAPASGLSAAYLPQAVPQAAPQAAPQQVAAPGLTPSAIPVGDLEEQYTVEILGPTLGLELGSGHPVVVLNVPGAEARQVGITRGSKLMAFGDVDVSGLEHHAVRPQMLECMRARPLRITLRRPVRDRGGGLGGAGGGGGGDGSGRVLNDNPLYGAGGAGLTQTQTQTQRQPHAHGQAQAHAQTQSQMPPMAAPVHPPPAFENRGGAADGLTARTGSMTLGSVPPGEMPSTWTQPQVPQAAQSAAAATAPHGAPAMPPASDLDAHAATATFGTTQATGTADAAVAQAPGLTSLPDVPGGDSFGGNAHSGGGAGAGLGDDASGGGGMTALEARLANLRS